MLKSDLNDGAALGGNAPPKFPPFSDPQCGAHFDFEDMCFKLDKVKKRRIMNEMMI